MIDLECTLIKEKEYQDDIGNYIPSEEKYIVPIIRNEEIYSKEYYEANKIGLKPSLRLRISALNYSEEKMLIYMDTLYKIIRTQKKNLDEIILICQEVEGKL